MSRRRQLCYTKFFAQGTFLIAETGGERGVLNLRLLQSAVARPQASFDSHDLYPDLFTKAAALLNA